MLALNNYFIRNKIIPGVFDRPLQKLRVDSAPDSEIYPIGNFHTLSIIVVL